MTKGDVDPLVRKTGLDVKTVKSHAGSPVGIVAFLFLSR